MEHAPAGAGRSIEEREIQAMERGFTVRRKAYESSFGARILEVRPILIRVRAIEHGSFETHLPRE